MHFVMGAGLLRVFAGNGDTNYTILLVSHLKEIGQFHISVPTSTKEIFDQIFY